MQESSEKFTAKAWILMDYDKNSYLRGQNVHQKREIASITKIYTFYACLEINNILNVQIDKIYVKILDFNNQGTTANLSIGQYIKIRDLYYALMLPSGNDAASNLAYYYGGWLDKKQPFPNFTWTNYKKEDFQPKLKYRKLLTQKFIHFINENVIKKQLLHKNTHLQNPHGLCDKFQVSTAWEVAQASLHFMKKHKLFREVVQQKQFKGRYLQREEDQNRIGDQLDYCWQNTNQLLAERNQDKDLTFFGIKTGHTTSAGSCLTSTVTLTIKGRQVRLLIAVLGCQSLQNRFSQTKKVLQHYLAYLQQLW